MMRVLKEAKQNLANKKVQISLLKEEMVDNREMQVQSEALSSK